MTPHSRASDVLIRVLDASDAAEFQALRLRALRDDGDAFGSTHEEEAGRDLATVSTRLAGDPGSGFVLGAALAPDGPLVGLAGCHRAQSRKRRHTATVWTMFVAGEARGRGVGRALLDVLVQRARAWPELTRLALSVRPDNAAARALYASSGFRSFGVEPRALRDGDRYFDEEHFWLPLHLE